ncbi:M12 family metallopeptidase [Pseudomonas allii]|uniref:M12 family metallopeptidase n=2 Tax=Pseudomonas allii TaxID=2740531 RepID=A0ACC6LB21_9PSED|nr:M12 family metallopeptidase [Pseudomonas allii]MDR9875559.1 M12 family metallopeptidase [Pseudomonas allii]NWN59785.1 hypothetical protein [Pseudomonas allii]
MSINTTYFTPASSFQIHSGTANNEHLESTKSLSRKKRGIAEANYLWPQGSTIKIGFTNLSKDEEKMVKENINKWAPYVNLKFEFVTAPKKADVRVEVDPTTDEGYAWVGTNSTKHPDDKAHVTIGTKASKEFIEDTIMHEWGHVLGLQHEHQHPNRKLEQSYFAHSPVLPDDDSLIISPYDKDSIMHYTAEYNSDGKLVFSSKQISEKDKEFVSKLYPPLPKKTSPPASKHPLQNPPN